MKKAILAMVVMLIAAMASAQEGREIYNKYSGKKGVSAVYISPSMFELMKSIPDMEIDGENVNIGKIIKSLSGMYILDIEDAELAKQLSSDINGMVAKNKYEMLMEAIDEEDVMHIYIVRKDDSVSDFLMIAESEGTVDVICIAGDIPFEDLQELIGAAASE